MEKDILIVENLAAFEKLINKDDRPYDINMMVMPGTLEDKHKNIDPELGIQPLRRRFNLVYLLLDGLHDVHINAILLHRHKFGVKDKFYLVSKTAK